jgi:hypothetical protein
MAIKMIMVPTYASKISDFRKLSSDQLGEELNKEYNKYDGNRDTVQFEINENGEIIPKNPPPIGQYVFITRNDDLTTNQYRAIFYDKGKRLPDLNYSKEMKIEAKTLTNDVGKPVPKIVQIREVESFVKNITETLNFLRDIHNTSGDKLPEKDKYNLADMKNLLQKSKRYGKGAWAVIVPKGQGEEYDVHIYKDKAYDSKLSSPPIYATIDDIVPSSGRASEHDYEEITQAKRDKLKVEEHLYDTLDGMKLNLAQLKHQTKVSSAAPELPQRQYGKHKQQNVENTYDSTHILHNTDKGTEHLYMPMTTPKARATQSSMQKEGQYEVINEQFQYKDQDPSKKVKEVGTQAVSRAKRLTDNSEMKTFMNNLNNILPHETTANNNKDRKNNNKRSSQINRGR